MNSIRIIEQFSGCTAEPDIDSFSIIVSSEKSRFDTSTVTLYPAPSDIRIFLRCPMKLSDSEAMCLSGFISDHNAALHRSGFHLYILQDHLCLRSSLYIDDMSSEDACDALGSMISAMMEKMTLIESSFLQRLFSTDVDFSANCKDDPSASSCVKEAPNAEDLAESSYSDKPVPDACEYSWMDEDICSRPPEDGPELYDSQDPLHSDLFSFSCREDEFHAGEVPDEAEKGEPYSFAEDKSTCEADVQPDTPPYPDLSIDLSNPLLRSYLAIPPIVNLRRELKRSVPAFNDLLQSSNQAEHASKESEG